MIETGNAITKITITIDMLKVQFVNRVNRHAFIRLSFSFRFSETINRSKHTNNLDELIYLELRFSELVWLTHMKKNKNIIIIGLHLGSLL